jgi:hypothetical protein
LPKQPIHQWWLERKNSLDAAQACIMAFESVDEDTETRQQIILDSNALYGHGTLDDYLGISMPAASLLGVNVIAPGVDTLVSEVTQHEPRPIVLTIGGDYKKRKRAEKLTSYLECKFREHNVWGLMRRSTKDAVNSGLGIPRAFEIGESGIIGYERIHPLNLLVDDRGAIDVAPQIFYARRAIDRTKLQALYPKRAEQLKDAPTADETYWHGYDSTADVVELIEAWRMASWRGNEDGRHMLVVQNCQPLVDEVYDRATPDMAFIRAIEPSGGFWGEVPVMRAAPAQLWLNSMWLRLQETQNLHAVVRCFVRPNSIQKTHLQNGIGQIVECTSDPTFMPTPAVPDRFEILIPMAKQWAFELLGVSELAATSRKPPGLDSEPAQRTYHEFETRRHVNFERDIENAICELARQTIRLERAIAERKKKQGKEHKVPYKTEGALESEDWFAIDLDDDCMSVQVRPASALPRSPSGKMKYLQEMQMQLNLPPDVFWRMVDDPDFEAVRAEYTASSEIIDKVLDRMLDGGEATVPEPYMDLDRAMLTCALKIQRAEVEEVSEENIQKLREFLVACQHRKKVMASRMAAMAAEVQAAMPAPAMPPGGPMPPGGNGAGAPGPPASPLPPGGGPMPPAGPPGPMPQ